MAEGLGEAKVILGADATPLKKSVQEAKTQVESLGETSVKAGADTERGFKQAGEAIEGKTAGVRKFTRALTSSIGVITGVVGSIGTLIALLTTLDRKWKEQQEAITRTNRQLEDFGNAIEDFRTKQFDSVEGLDRAFVSVARAIDDSKDLTVKQADALFYELRDIVRQREQEVAKTVRESTLRTELDRSRIQTEQARKTRQQLDSIMTGLSEGMVPEEDIIVERYKQLQKQLESVIEQGLFSPAQVDEYLARITAAIEKRRDFEIKASRERIAEEEREEIAKGERVAKANADAMEREMSAALERLNTSFGFNSGGLNNIVGAINGLRTEVQRRRN
jgi:hypothetical protein